MKVIKNMLPYLLIDGLGFYLLPLLINDTTTAMIILLVVMPLICFNVAIFYTSKHGFNAWFSILVGLLFFPSVYIYYNETALVYIVAFASMSLFGSFVGKYVKLK